jgi:hypothetical protein
MMSSLNTLYRELAFSELGSLTVNFGLESLVDLLTPIYKGIPDIDFFEAAKKLLKAPNLVNLLHKLFIMMAENGANIENVIKGIRIDFVGDKKDHDEVLIL